MPPDDAAAAPPPTLAAAGWKPMPASDYPALVGPFLARRDGEGGWRYGFVAEQRHLNLGGVVHGGMLMSFADDALGMTVWQAVGRRPVTTVQLNTQFVSPVRLGELVEVPGRGAARHADAWSSCAACWRWPGARWCHADGVWKILGGN